MSPILKFWPKLLEKNNNNNKITVMFTSEGRDGQTQVFFIVSITIFSLLTATSTRGKRSARQGKMVTC